MGLETKNVFVSGRDYEDIVLYLSKVLAAEGLRPVITDYTPEHDMYYWFPHVRSVDPLKGIIDCGGVGYTYGINREYEKTDHDITFRIYGHEFFNPEGNQVIFVTDERAGNIGWLEKGGTYPGSILIVRDYSGAAKHRIEYIAEKLESEKVYLLPADIGDRISGVLAGHNDRFKFNGISAQLKNMLLELAASFLGDISPKEVRKAYKTAAGGGSR